MLSEAESIMVGFRFLHGHQRQQFQNKKADYVYISRCIRSESPFIEGICQARDNRRYDHRSACIRPIGVTVTVGIVHLFAYGCNANRYQTGFIIEPRCFGQMPNSYAYPIYGRSRGDMLRLVRIECIGIHIGHAKKRESQNPFFPLSHVLPLFIECSQRSHKRYPNSTIEKKSIRYQPCKSGTILSTIRFRYGNTKI